MLRQLYIAVLMLMVYDVTYAEEPHFTRTTEWVQMENEPEWYADYGEPYTDNIVRIIVRKSDGEDITFETSDECHETQTVEGMSWTNGQQSATYTDCEGNLIEVDNLPSLQEKWRPFPQEVEDTLKNPPSNDRDDGPALVAGKAEGS